MKKYIQLLFVAAAIIIPLEVFAAGPLFSPPDPAIKIPGLNLTKNIPIDFSPSTCPEITQSGAYGCLHIPWIGQYLSSIYTFAISAASILAALVLAIAGFLWLTAAGNTTRIELAKKHAGGALLGFVLILGSYTILYLINPKLVQFQERRIAVLHREELPQIALIQQAGNCNWQSPVREATNFTPGQACPDGSVDPIGGSPDSCIDSRTGNQVCCCTGLKISNGGDDLHFQQNIERQMEDAKPELAELINCMQKLVPLTINSISDSNIAAGTCRPWECRAYGSSIGCQHTCSSTSISAHYGGIEHTAQSKHQRGFSCAVDIDNTVPYDQLKNAALSCGTRYILNEGNHYHVSVVGCGAN
ncbi:hypothetical protein COV04_00105 [Candidatus Uhrbacteria bacterium CG10_big_fil_rev_8_21_14_0_10_48_11]|uniref:Peptidase M15A C-terminal domain-containing protein n=1 Tax=Candidatus Uhrbacteria bacterium CG10_big_fil_rev_8_21_14_0_10_48_11 TaxID=1975037 RepID=A0A2M8LFN7_9BACT|nr:MAG: hypothetical protein COV04_00105 [Candidatus Uhrbacteria bacterium CG10_big_fil_rev_8_21_14_0_10_48_11]